MYVKYLHKKRGTAKYSNLDCAHDPLFTVAAVINFNFFFLFYGLDHIV